MLHIAAVAASGDDGQVRGSLAALPAQKGVSRLMSGDADQKIVVPSFLFAAVELLERLVKNRVGDLQVAVLDRGAHGKLDDRRQLCQTHARGTHGDIIDLFFADGENSVLADSSEQVLLSLVAVGKIDKDPSVKTAEDRGIETLFACRGGVVVGGGKDKYGLGTVALKAVHLREQRGQDIFNADGIVAARSCSGNGVDLVDEDDRRRILAGGTEHIQKHILALTVQALDELAAHRGDKGDVGGSRGCFRQHGLAGSGRSVEQYALGSRYAGTHELLRVFQIIDKIFQLALCILSADDPIEINVGFGYIAQDILSILGIDGNRLFQVKELDMGDVVLMIE